MAGEGGNIPLKEAFKRLAIVRAAKQAKARSGQPANLTPSELDEVLPPVPCARTRARTKEVADGR